MAVRYCNFETQSYVKHLFEPTSVFNKITLDFLPIDFDFFTRGYERVSYPATVEFGFAESKRLAIYYDGSFNLIDFRTNTNPPTTYGLPNERFDLRGYTTSGDEWTSVQLYLNDKRGDGTYYTETITHGGVNFQKWRLTSKSNTPSYTDLAYYKIDCNVPVFNNVDSACEYVANGTIDGNCLNAVSLIDTINTMTRWFINQTVKSDNVTLDLLSKSHAFSITPNAKIYLVASEHTDATTPNMQLFISQMPCYLLDGETPLPVNVLTEELSAYFYGEWQNTDTGKFFNSYITTNIPIFTNLQDGQDYANGLTDGSKAINGVGGGKISTIGDDLDETEIETSTFNMARSGAKVWALTDGQMIDFNNFIFNDSNKTNLLNGLWLYGDNPSNAIVSLFYVPFDISNFYNMGDLSRIPFGTFVDMDASPIGKKCLVGGKKITICNTFIAPTYKDYRDFTNFKYELKLPFMPMVTINHNNYLNKNLKVDMYFDAPSRMVKYVLYADDKITDTYECGVGVNMPYVATDNYNKLTENVNNLIHLGGDAISKNPLNFAVDSVKTAVDFIKEPKHTVNGGFSQGVNTYDVRYVYLRITEYETVKPSDLNKVYNYPSYYIGSVSALSGYCELSDIRFNTFSGTNAELTALKSMLKSGIII